MSLKVLLEVCKALDCSPADVYPEIEIYDKGFSVPTTQSKPQDIDSKNVTNITNHYYHTPNFIKGLFSNICILDVNSMGALLFKLAILIIVIDDLLYLTFRLFGYHYPPFFAGDQLSQLIWGWMVFTWLMSFILPLLIRHWLVYIITLLTFRGIVGVIYNAFTMGSIQNHDLISPHAVWIIHTIIPLILTLAYAYIVKKYLRSHGRRKKITN